MPLISQRQDDEQSEGAHEAMLAYWNLNSKNASMEEMMQNTDTASIRILEEPEIISLLPSFANMDIVELACGIGRFTSLLAPEAKSVVALDFMKNFVLKNEETNGHLGNIKFVQADATQFDMDDASVDLVFSSWMLEYLTDEENVELLTKILRWLRPGGYFFFRESCFRISGNMAQGHNPTFYRMPIYYCQMMNYVRSVHEGEHQSFKLVRAQNLSSLIKLKNNPGQVTWLAQKQIGEEKNEARGYQTFQEFLDKSRDKSQYSMNYILRYEKIFGSGFISTNETTENFVSKLNLKEGEKVLDVGCGTGGSDFYMAKNYAVTVRGLDLSANMVCTAMERQLNSLDQGDRSATNVVFEWSDVTERQFQPDSFDAIYSRDTILHIQDKSALFSSFFSWTKPGGRVLISDYCCGQEDRSLWSEPFSQYVKQRGYHMVTVQQYGKLLEGAGYRDVEAIDITDSYVEISERELETLKARQSEFVAEFSQEDYDYTVDWWKSKVASCLRGDHRWGLFVAKKPL